MKVSTVGCGLMHYLGNKVLSLTTSSSSTGLLSGANMLLACFPSNRSPALALLLACRRLESTLPASSNEDE